MTFDELRAKAESQGQALLKHPGPNVRYELRTGDGKRRADSDFVSTDLAAITERIDSWPTTAGKPQRMKVADTVQLDDVAPAPPTRKSRTRGNGIVLEFAQCTGPLDTPLGARLRKIEELITSTEGDEIHARWEFGRELLEKRVGKQLPKGLRAALIKDFALSGAELNYRMQFADTFTTKEKVSTAVETFTSWTQIKGKALPKTPRPPVTFKNRMASRIDRMVKEAKTAQQRRALAALLIAASQQITETTPGTQKLSVVPTPKREKARNDQIF
jgi:hypothetical protein